MKTKRLAMTGLVVGLLLALSNDALAFYNPSTGRWLSRDPIGEESFLREQIRRNRLVPSTVVRESRRPAYVLLQNNPIGRVDHLGLYQTPLTEDELSTCRKDIERALEILRSSLKNSCGCTDYFKQTKRCKQDLLSRINSFTVNIDNDADSYYCDGVTYGYTDTGDGKWQTWVCGRTCREGRWCMAATIIHELFHDCNDDTVDHEDGARGAEKACGFNKVCP